MYKIKSYLGILLGIVILLGCSKEVEDQGPPPNPDPYTQVIFEFTFNVDGADLEPDTVKYENAAGNIYSVSKLQFLVGKFRLDSWEETEKIYINEYHLVDLKDPSTWKYKAKDTIKYGSYQNLTLFMGFEEALNKTGNYPDLDNKGWGWPPKYGGGYYTLRMDEGFYLSNAASTTKFPYNLAVGGKIRKESQTDTSYVANDQIYATMTDTPENSGFEVPLGTKIVKLEISMDLNKLFKDRSNNSNYNFDIFQSNIEENATASKILSSNLDHCFRLRSVTYNEEAEAAE